MSRALLSDDWYRVRGLKPRLRAHLRIERHLYRGRAWWVLDDPVGATHHRFDAATRRVLDLMNGQRDMGEIWDAVVADLDDRTPTQDDVIALLGQLHAGDLLQVDVTPAAAEMFERHGRHQRRRWLGRIGNPVAMRLPVCDPDRALQRIVAATGRRTGLAVTLLWLLVVGSAALLVPSHWGELTANGTERLLAGSNWLLMALLFPAIKIVHELGHALAARWRGAEVHEIGLMLLVFYPVPYVDVSGANALAGKWQRALVGAAGMLAELFIAAIAFDLWLVLEPGSARAVAFDVVVLASVTTLFFNANPLLRYDGYYILADLIECPNLALRAGRYWRALLEHCLFGTHGARPVDESAGERRWFIVYAPLSFGYRLLVSVGVAILVAQKFFVVGALIALWTVASGIVWPLLRGTRSLLRDPRVGRHRLRVRGLIAAAGGLAAFVLFVLPMPYHTNAEGVLWLPDQAILRTQESGFVTDVLARTGALVQPGQAVLQSVEPGLAARIDAQAGKVEEAQAKVDAAWGVSPAQAQQLEQGLRQDEATLDRLHDEGAHLTVRTSVAGTLLLDKADDLRGRFLKKGEVVGYVRTADPPLVRVALSQADIETVTQSSHRIEIKLPQEPARAWSAQLRRNVPAALHQLPSAVLGTKGGGAAVVDPRDDKGLTTVESLFELELELPPTVPHEWLGSRVFVRFEAAPEPIGLRLWRGLRRAFLSQFQI